MPPRPPRRSPPPARPRMDARRRRSPEELLHALDERGAERAALLGRFLERLQRLALLGVEPGRHLEHEAIARVARPRSRPRSRRWGIPRPRSFRSWPGWLPPGTFSVVHAAQDRHLDLGAEGQLRERQRDVAVEIGAVPGEERVLVDAHPHEEITGAATVQPVVAGAPAAHASCRRRCRRECRIDTRCSVRERPWPRQSRHGLELICPSPPHFGHGRATGSGPASTPPGPAATRIARDRSAAGLDAESVAPRAGRHLGQLDLGLDAGGGLLEGDRHLVGQVLAGERVRGPGSVGCRRSRSSRRCR